MAERRRHPRQRSLLGGRIILHNGRATLNCVVRNLSGSGAMIACGTAVTLPQVFDLLVPSKNRHMRVCLVWRAADRAGVALVPATA